MKKILILVMFLLGLGVYANANNEVDLSKMSKKERKAYEKRQKEIQDSTVHAEAVEAIKNRVFLLIVDKTMKRVMTPEDSRRNFFLMENGKIMVQSGRAGATTGNNNIGGYSVITEIVGDVKFEEKKNGEVKCEFNVVNEYLSGKVNIKLDKKTNYGEIGILQNGSGQYAIMFGHIVPFDPSLVGPVIEIGKLFTAESWDAFSLGAKRDVGVLSDYLSGTRTPGDKNYTPEAESPFIK